MKRFLCTRPRACMYINLFQGADTCTNMQGRRFGSGRTIFLLSLPPLPPSLSPSLPLSSGPPKLLGGVRAWAECVPQVERVCRAGTHGAVGQAGPERRKGLYFQRLLSCTMKSHGHGSFLSNLVSSARVSTGLCVSTHVCVRRGLPPPLLLLPPSPCRCTLLPSQLCCTRPSAPAAYRTPYIINYTSASWGRG
jgi:hypothetical protein